MRDPTNPIAIRIQHLLGPTYRVLEFDEPTHSAAEAAAAIGCELAQIAKSILLQGKQSRHPYMVVASGTKKIDKEKLASLAGEPVRMADASFVEEVTGYSPGGVCPIGLPADLTIYFDGHLMKLPVIWAAAGTSYSVFALTPAQLQSLLPNAQCKDVTQDLS